MGEFQQTRAGARAGATRGRWLRLLIPASLAWAGTVSAAVPNVVASIGPLRALAGAVIGDLGEPAQIVRGYGSPHAYQMRPSDAAGLRDADLILWVGPTLETFLQRPLAAAAGRHTRVLTLSETPGLELLANRDAGVFAGDGHTHGADAPGGYDPHIWLSPYNAKVMAAAIADALGRLDAPNAPTYAANLERFQRRVDDMQADIAARLAPVREVPFVVFHDAFQYFEKSFGLNAIGSLSVSPDRLPSAKRITALRERIAQSGVRCVFREPQFESALVTTLLEGSRARSGVLDPLGADVAPGPDAYFQLMNANADALIECLRPGKS